MGACIETKSERRENQASINGCGGESSLLDGIKKLREDEVSRIRQWEEKRDKAQDLGKNDLVELWDRLISSGWSAVEYYDRRIRHLEGLSR